MRLINRCLPLLSPARLYQFCGRLYPIFFTAWIACISLGLIGGMLIAPADYQQGDAFRMIYLHVPAAFLSLQVYAVMAVSAALALIFRIKIYETVVLASPSIGAAFTLLALITGSLWGKPMWGTWWIWDARLTSELILLFIYLGMMALANAIPNPQKAARTLSIVALVGFIDIPIIHYSVYWWQTLHQGATLSLLAKPKIDAAMLWPLLLMILGFTFYYAWVLCLRLRTQLIKREPQAQWCQQLLKETANG